LRVSAGTPSLMTDAPQTPAQGPVNVAEDDKPSKSATSRAGAGRAQR
jgi:hypothetical protein